MRRSRHTLLHSCRFAVPAASNGVSEMSYHRARYYHPQLRRFLNQDTVLGAIGTHAGMNRFAYANGQPVTGIDPLGLWNLWNPLTWGLPSNPGENPWTIVDSSAEWNAAAVGAMGGAIGFQNALTFGLSSTAGYSKCDVDIGRQVGKLTMIAEGAVATAGAFSLQGATPYFYSGAGADAQAASSGYILTDTTAGTLGNAGQTTLNFLFGQATGQTIGRYAIWYPLSAGYAATSGLLNGVAGYVGNGTGLIWLQVEQPILQKLGVTIVTR